MARIEHLILLASALGMASVLAFHLMNRMTRFTRRCIDEVGDFLSPVDEMELARLLDPKADLRARFSNFGNRRRQQRVRLELIRHYLKRMLWNGIVNRHWVTTEIFDIDKHHLEYDEETWAKIRQLNAASRRFNRVARLVLVKIWFLCLLRFEDWRLVPMPAISALRNVGSVDLLEAYRALKAAAVSMASCHGEEVSAAIAALM